MADILADSLNKLKIYDSIGKDYCELYSTKLVKAVLQTLKENGYIKNFEEFTEGKFKKVKVVLAKKINDIGVIKPRHAVSIDEYNKYEARYIPSKNFGMLVVSTPKGVMSNKKAKESRLGGRLLAYVY
ncbi:MAG: 30S ribosomal protein S8 [Candidatus Micrarchaeia archaeon]